ncbi:MAG: hypothetical protein C0440_01375 [Candidatus Pelagibacter sp.]|nr:hypothetical protein [Candidatus Pelagibacter sp.]
MLTKNDPYYKYIQKLKSAIKRSEFIDSIDLNKNVLEVGPFNNPLLKGKNVNYFDILDQERLKEKIMNDPFYDFKKTHKVELLKIPYIKYVEPTGNMDKIKDRFNIVFSSHNIEHQVNLIKHLQQIQNLLNTKGKIFLIIPDRRYCSDHYISETHLSDVIDVFESNPKKHDLKTILTNRCERSTHNDSYAHWQSEHGQHKSEELKNCYQEALKEYKNSGNDYIDAHRWRFTPQSFYKIISDLNEMGYIKLKVDTIYDTKFGSCEFYAVLSLQ